MKLRTKLMVLILRFGFIMVKKMNVKFNPVYIRYKDTH